MESFLDRWVPELAPAAMVGALVGMGFKMVQSMVNKERSAEELQKSLMFHPQALKKDLRLTRAFLELQHFVNNTMSGARTPQEAREIQDIFMNAGSAADQVLFLVTQLELGKIPLSYDTFSLAERYSHDCCNLMRQLVVKCRVLVPPNFPAIGRVKESMRQIEWSLKDHVNCIFAQRKLVPQPIDPCVS